MSKVVSFRYLIIIPTADATGRNTFQQHGIGSVLIVSLTQADRPDSLSTNDTETSIDSDTRLILA